MASNQVEALASEQMASSSSLGKPSTPSSLIHAPKSSSPAISTIEDQDYEFSGSVSYFKPIPTPEPINLPADFPLVEKTADHRIPLHWSEDDNAMLFLGMPDSKTSSVEGDQGYTKKIDDIIWNEEIGIHVPYWGLYSALRYDKDVDRIDLPWDYSNPVYFGFEMLADEKEKWRLIDAPIRKILKEAFGARYPPIRYLNGVKNVPGLFD